MRLTIIVPYRDRAHHLDAFLPHVRAYFARDKIDRTIPYQVLIIEQDSGLPFNRGGIAEHWFRNRRTALRLRLLPRCRLLADLGGLFFA